MRCFAIYFGFNNYAFANISARNFLPLTLAINNTTFTNILTKGFITDIDVIEHLR